MTTIAGLQFDIDSSDARTAKADLEGMAGAGAKAGSAADALQAAMSRTGAATRSASDALRTGTAGASSAAQALRGHAESARLSGYQSAQLSAQLQDLFVQIQAGGSPITALIQQGSQLASGFGGVGNALRAVGTLVTPATVAIAGAAASVGALAVAALLGSSESRELENALKLSGNAAGLTGGQFALMANRIAASTGSLQSDTSELLRVLATGGEQTSSTLEASARAAISLSRLNGKTSAENALAFNGITASVSDYAAKANRAYAFLTAAQFEQIRGLEAQGRTAEAVRMTMEALSTTLDTRTPAALGYLDRALKATATSWDKFWTSLKGVGAPETAEANLDGLRQKIEQLQKLLANPGTLPGQRSAYARELAGLQQAAQSQEAYLRESQRRERKAADEREEQQDKITKSSRGYQDSLAAIALAGANKTAAASGAALALQGLEADRAYRQFELSAQAYRDRMFEIESKRIDAEEALAQKQLQVERGRTIKSEQEANQRTAAIIAAETRLAQFRVQRARLQAELDTGALDPKPRAVLDDPQTAFRRAEIQGYDATNKALAEQALQTMAGERATVQYGASLALVAAARERSNETLLQALVLGDRERDNLQRLRALEEDFATRRQQLDADRAASRISGSAYDKRLADLQDFHAQALRAESQFQQRRAQLEGDWQTGAKRGLDNYLSRSKDVATSTADLFEGSFKNAGDALAQYVTTGKADFRSLELAILQGLNRIAVEEALIKPIASYLKGSDNSLSSFFGSLLGVSKTGDAGFGDYTQIGAALLGGRAAGGGVRAGGMYEVNEQGPELLSAGGRTYLMMGGRDGSVTPNSALAGRGATVVNNNFTISGATDRRTQMQIASAAGTAVRVALARNE